MSRKPVLAGEKSQQSPPKNKSLQTVDEVHRQQQPDERVCAVNKRRVCDNSARGTLAEKLSWFYTWGKLCQEILKITTLRECLENHSVWQQRRFKTYRCDIDVLKSSEISVHGPFSTDAEGCWRVKVGLHSWQSSIYCRSKKNPTKPPCSFLLACSVIGFLEKVIFY